MMGIAILLAQAKDIVGRTAPFNGWSPEREKVAMEWSSRDAGAILDSLLSVWDFLKSSGYYDPVLDRKISLMRDRFLAKGNIWDLILISSFLEDAQRLMKVKVSPSPNAIVKISPPLKTVNGNYSLNDGNKWASFPLSNSAVMERKPTIVQVGEADTLFAALEVENCSAVCPVSHSNSCILVKYSYDQGASWNPAFCIESPLGNVKSPGITSDNFRRVIGVVYSFEKSPTDNDIGLYMFHAGDFTKNRSVWVDTTSTNTISPSAKFTTNLGEPSCEGQWIGDCPCTSNDNKLFIAVSKVNSSGDASGIRVYRGDVCASNINVVYEGLSRKGSAYTGDNQPFVAVGNYPPTSSSVCPTSGGGENAIHIVYTWQNSSTEHRIEHLYTDPSNGWGSTWISTTVFSGLFYPISQPTISVARTTDTSNMPHLITFEIRYSPSDADIYFVYRGSLSGSWSVGNIEKSFLDSRTPIVISDAENLACPNIKTSVAENFHIVFYHKCDVGNWLCSASSYNSTFRPVAIRNPWNSPGVWQQEYCNGNADYTIIPPPPAFENGGYWQDWRNIYPAVYRRSSSSTTPWWLGVLWVYNDSTTSLDAYWTVSDCALGGDDELSTYESFEKGSDKPVYYSVDGRRVSSNKRGILFVKEGNKVRKVLRR